MSDHPYTQLPTEAFWRESISMRHPMEISDIYRPKFSIDKTQKIATAGSCFAQHFSKALKQRGYNFIDEEPAPNILEGNLINKYNYEIYSARYANIYTARQMLQTLKRALGEFAPQDTAWYNNGRFFDPLRPLIEPAGYDSRAELDIARTAHLSAVKRVFESTDIFVFTFGLTEAWAHHVDGLVYPMCPGTVGGKFDPKLHKFHNFTFQENYDDMVEFIELARILQPNMRFLLTVSPVPLTATASGEHVLAATVRSKSTLRTVCAEICDHFEYVDYFPSYELISSPPFKGFFFEHDMRSVSATGVDFAMTTFFRAHADDDNIDKNEKIGAPELAQNELQCEEEILKGFGK
ncbi:MAG: GSCFA domain-containing protein [Rhodobacteraceae bacterium]|nr:GSCFA domain-containing protein [Paracoccaceae bacterium]